LWEDKVVAGNDTPHESVRVFRFTDADAFLRAHDTSETEYIRLANLPFRAELIHLDLGAFRIRLARFSLPPKGSDPAKASATADFEALLDLWGMPPLPRGVHSALSLAPGMDAAALPAALAGAATLAGAIPHAVGMPGFVPSVLEGVRDLLMRVLSAQGAHGDEPPRRTRDLLRLVAAADKYLREHVARPIYTVELCDALAVSPRKLHNAFIGTYGVSPHVYLKCRRLALVRKALRVTDPPVRLVKSVALAHGFWHMGHFAHDYFMMFNETPSQTLASGTW
jgi:AraC-like DNA-binding protein